MSDPRHLDDDSEFFDSRSSSNLNGKILLSSIISLSIVVVLVTLLHLYARFVLRRQARRRAALQDPTLVARTHPEPPRKGLDPAVIASLPMLTYKHMDPDPEYESGSLGSTVECAVCLTVLEDGEMVRVLPNCKHHFHAECIDKWLTTQSTCPICRHEAEPRPMLLPLPRESCTKAEQDQPTAPPMEGTSDGVVHLSSKVTEIYSRLSSFRSMLSRDRSSRRIESCRQEDGIEDVERQ